METKCYHCKIAKCSLSCPFGNDIPNIIEYYEKQDFKSAYELLLKNSIIPNVVSRVCFGYCKNSCIKNIKNKPINFREVEVEITKKAKEQKIDYIETLKNVIKKSGGNFLKTPEKVTIIGNGPSGLSCAIYLSVLGYEVTLIDKNKKIGGLLRYGIPDFRFEKEELDFLEQIILKLGIKLRQENLLNLDLKSLDAKTIVIAIGLDQDIEFKTQVDRKKVINGKEFLVQDDLNKTEEQELKNKKIAIIGGGNTAIDFARKVLRKGAIPTIIYRRSKELMPANIQEVDDAQNEGVSFLFNTDIEKINMVEDRLEIQIYKTNETKNREEKVKKIENTSKTIEFDYFANCIGATNSKNVKNYLEKYGIDLTKKSYEIEGKKVYLIGDIAGNIQDVPNASKSGIECAKEIVKKIE